MTESMWPELSTDTVPSPLSPITEQADLLAQMTNNVVKAELYQTEPSQKGYEFAFDFDLIVDVIDYRFTLFAIYQSVEGYPVMISPIEKIEKDLGWTSSTGNPDVIARNNAKKTANSADELNEILGRVLSSRVTKQILETLIAQAKHFKRG